MTWSDTDAAVSAAARLAFSVASRAMSEALANASLAASTHFFIACLMFGRLCVFKIFVGHGCLHVTNLFGKRWFLLHTVIANARQVRVI